MELKNRQLREIYADLLVDAAARNDAIVSVDADLRKAAKTNAFADKYPERAINVGVAEANMIGVAAGLANMGKVPFTHTFTPFATRRVFDQVTLSVAYAGLHVKMVGSDPGIMAQLNGATHMSFEDVGLMRTLPDMVIFEPVDGVQLAACFDEIVAHPGPVYIRLLRQEFEAVFEEGTSFSLGKAHVLEEGDDVVIFATGILVAEALKAVSILKEEGISATLVNIHTVKPLDTETIVRTAKRCGGVVTAENHNVINGLGSAVAETLCEHHPVPMKRVGVMDRFGEVGKKDYLMETFGLKADNIVTAARDVIRRKEETGRKHG